MPRDEIALSKQDVEWMQTPRSAAREAGGEFLRIGAESNAAGKAAGMARRNEHGSIDVPFYESRARILRARFMMMWLRRLATWVVQGWRRRRLASELYALDERTLRDLGIARSDIPAIASGSYCRDATRQRRCTSDGTG